MVPRPALTTHQTIDSLFRSDPWSAGNTFTFASTRSPGFTAYSDPDGAVPYSDFYRSMVALPSLSTDDVTGAGSEASCRLSRRATPPRR